VPQTMRRSEITISTTYTYTHIHQNGSRAHPASYPLGTWGSFPGDKAVEAWSWRLTSIWCRGQTHAWHYASTPQYVFTAWCL